ncbi:hypothetical protein TWF696_007808 [Orbilia brochopaga]|uniref:Uncharacterized protein n=1 Tax=Orbilia brochopaga TaxID=3140254 RepID=A0AAV9USF8_9PEZI
MHIVGHESASSYIRAIPKGSPRLSSVRYDGAGLKNNATGRCAYFDVGNTGLQTSIAKDGHIANGVITLGPCQNPIDPRGGGGFRIEPHERYICSPSTGNINITASVHANLQVLTTRDEYMFPITARQITSKRNITIVEPPACPQNTFKSMLVPELRANSITNIRQALWGCAPSQFESTSNHSYLVLPMPSPRHWWPINFAREPGFCSCNEQLKWRAAKCEYQKQRVAAIAYDFCKAISEVSAGSTFLADILVLGLGGGRCQDPLAAERPTIPSDPGSGADIDYSDCLEQAKKWGPPPDEAARMPRPCPPFDPKAPLNCG